MYFKLNYCLNSSNVSNDKSIEYDSRDRLTDREIQWKSMAI